MLHFPPTPKPRSFRATPLALAACLGLAAASPALGVASFEGLGDLGGGIDESRAFGISGDGTVAVGESASGNGDEAFRWTGGTMTGLGDLDFGIFDSRANAASADGSAVAGTGNAATGDQAFLWNTTSGSPTGLGSLSAGGTSQGFGISSDGLTVVGKSDSPSGPQAFRWQGSMSPLGDLTGGSFASQAFAVSGDGLIVVGDSSSSNGTEAFVWNGVMSGIGDLDGGSFGSSARGISANGNWVVGQGTSADGPEAFVWNGTTMTGLGDLPGGSFHSIAHDVSNDGIIVGESGGTAFVYMNGTMQPLIDVLIAEGLAAAVANWTLDDARAISDDGRTIVGLGTNPAGDTEAFIATIPEPTSGALLGLGLLGLATRRRARARG